MKTLEIEVKDCQDAALLARLNRPVHDLHVEMAPHYFRPWEEGPMTEGFAAMLAKGCRARVAWLGPEPAAYLLFRRNDRQSSCFNRELRSILVDQVCVLPQHRGQGLGQALMEDINALARKEEVEELELLTWTDNENALGFFQRAGFRPQTIRMISRIQP